VRSMYDNDDGCPCGLFHTSGTPDGVTPPRLSYGVKPVVR
jgi:hypothetical protein